MRFIKFANLQLNKNKIIFKIDMIKWGIVIKSGAPPLTMNNRIHYKIGENMYVISSSNAHLCSQSFLCRDALFLPWRFNSGFNNGEFEYDNIIRAKEVYKSLCSISIK